MNLQKTVLRIAFCSRVNLEFISFVFKCHNNRNTFSFVCYTCIIFNIDLSSRSLFTTNKKKNNIKIFAIRYVLSENDYQSLKIFIYQLIKGKKKYERYYSNDITMSFTMDLAMSMPSTFDS